MKSHLILVVLALVFTASRCQTFLINSPLQAIAGENLTIVCVAPGGDAISFTVRENEVLFGDSRLIRAGNNDTHSIFVLTDTMPSDNGRVLTCGQAETNSDPVTVEIFFIENLVFNVTSAPVNLISDSDITVEENSPVVSIPFIFDANPMPDPEGASLQRLGGDLNQEAVSVVGVDAVEFNEVNRDEAGMYTINIMNIGGTASLSFNLRVEYGPTLSVVGTSAVCRATADSSIWLCSAALGDDVTLTCESTSIPQATVEISRIRDSSNVNDIDSGTIMIEGFSESNFDNMFSCNATNVIFGESRTDILTIMLGDIQDLATTADVGDMTMATESTERMVPICFINIFILASMLIVLMS